MKDTNSHKMSRRERQIMDVLYRLREASVAEVVDGLPDPPGYSAVRALLAVLEDKGYVSHVRQGRAFRYRPTVSRERARTSALRHLVKTFYDGSVSRAVASLVDMSADAIDDEELKRLEKLIAQSRRKRGKS